MREIRKVANAAAAKRGHTITLSVRLSSKPSGSRKLGMEADVWAKEGIVDVIVPTSPWESIDFDIPLAEWRTWTGDKVPIVPSADEGITENGKRRIATFEDIAAGPASCMNAARKASTFSIFSCILRTAPSGTASFREVSPVGRAACR